LSLLSYHGLKPKSCSNLLLKPDWLDLELDCHLVWITHSTVS
jgi:hypothetical protein